jgi:hypothetical protein
MVPANEEAVKTKNLLFSIPDAIFDEMAVSDTHRLCEDFVPLTESLGENDAVEKMFPARDTKACLVLVLLFAGNDPETSGLMKESA